MRVHPSGALGGVLHRCSQQLPSSNFNDSKTNPHYAFTSASSPVTAKPPAHRRRRGPLPAIQPTSNPTNQPTNQPTDHPTNQPINQLTYQSTYQPTNRPINTRRCQGFGLRVYHPGALRGVFVFPDLRHLGQRKKSMREGVKENNYFTIIKTISCMKV